MNTMMFFSLVGALVVVCIALALILLKEAQKQGQGNSKAKEELLEKEEAVAKGIAAEKELQAKIESLKNKNEELTRGLASKETLYKELNGKYEALKAQLEEEKAKQENLQKPADNQGVEKKAEPTKEDTPVKQDEAPPDKTTDTDVSSQDVSN